MFKQPASGRLYSIVCRRQSILFHQLGDGSAQIARRADGDNTGSFHGGELAFRGALAARGDRARVAHALAGRSRRTGDETDDRLLHVVLDVLGAGFFSVTADLAKLLDKAWEDKSLDEVLAARVGALAGVSDADAAALQQAFNIKTVGDLGRNKHVRAARALSDLAELA